jgi:hypothetical protein
MLSILGPWRAFEGKNYTNFQSKKKQIFLKSLAKYIVSKGWLQFMYLIKI